MIIHLFQLNGHFSISFFLTSITWFLVFPYFTIITSIQSLNVVHRDFKFQTISIAVKLADDVFSAELLAIGKTEDGLIIENVENAIIELDAFQHIEFVKCIFIFFKLLYSFL